MKTIATQLNLTLILLLLLSSCSDTSKKEGDRIITVTIEPQRYFTEAIAGDKFTVVSMVPKGSNPESYDPSPKQLVSLGNSEAYFRIGHIGFETIWMDRLTQNAPKVKVFDLSKGVDFIKEADYAHGDHVHAGGVDPHIWNSTINAKIIAHNILDALCALDSTHNTYYKERHASLIQQIEATDSIISSLLIDNEYADHAFMIYHPALAYFARDYNLQQICIEEGGKEPSPKQLKDLMEAAMNEDVRIIFIQPEFDKRNAEIIAEQTGTKVVPVNPLSYQWEEEMIHIAKSLVSDTL